MTTLLGASSFACGILPLSFTFSKNHLLRLTLIGTGLLLGTALGVIIPEGIEALVEAQIDPALLSSRVALSLLFGFTSMLVVEQFLSPHSHSSSDVPAIPVHDYETSSIEFDAELGELESRESHSRPGFVQVDGNPRSLVANGMKARAYPLTFGLVIHSLADGLALGVSLFPNNKDDSSRLSFIVFLAIIVHKAPTSLALTTSLLATSLPRPECKKHLAVFSATTPVATFATYAFLSFFGAGDHADWTGLALLISGGTFLYVATVLQPVSDRPASGNASEIHKSIRVLLIIFGMLVPFTLSSLLGHGH
ncbi:ZIP-like iron-zinc transporter [Guyanagaster necrorhizus]|uniref:ZIP-like iron-zinc transporter n=1 Tax=Guyanagaster necrorhizus TaxID=856835 RepID=A0A9P7VMA9_9AGAR|nr:ZIP-like iron-zinc transporter [Guyanagaster necrorhizus MCA 3950]KAG7443125.1 ZIP-like iron-zinc transporter [Guyanagaster necrorhizus MCA 3950]